MNTIGPYRLETLVGRGASSQVWRARGPGPDGEEVAIKLGAADGAADGGGEADGGGAGVAGGAELGAADGGGAACAERLRKEAALLARLDHPNIVTLLDLVETGHGPALVMPLAPGGSLLDRLVARGRLSPAETAAWLGPVAGALDALHDAGFVHGDLKPSNILRGAGGSPVLVDLGASATSGSHAPVVGTPGYLDPARLASGRAEVANDVYGLAAVAHQCLTGRVPEPGTSLAPGGRVPPGLTVLLTSALAIDPALRPATARDFAEGLWAASGAASDGGAEGFAEGLWAASGAASDRGAEDFGDGPVPVVSGRLDPGAGDFADGLSCEGRDRAGPGTRDFGPRPPRDVPPPRPGRAGSRVAIVVLALVLAAVGGVLGSRSSPAPSSRRAYPARPPATPARAVRCPRPAPLPASPGDRHLTADLSGDGCPVPVLWSPQRQELTFRLAPGDAAPRRFAFVPAAPDAQPLFGDWDCDGDDTPGQYQPGTGLVVTIPDLPRRVDEEVAGRRVDSGVRNGRARVVEHGDGWCDSVEVTAP